MAPRKKVGPVPKGNVPLERSETRASGDARLLGPADEKESIRVTIVLRRRSDGPPLPGFDHYKTSPEKRQRITSEEFARNYGAHPDEIAKVAAFARNAGLTVVRTHAGRRVVKVTGTVSQLSLAFGVTLSLCERTVTRRVSGRRTHVRETYRGREGPIHVPPDIAPFIVGVFGLDNPRLAQRAATGDPPISAPLTMAQVTGAYNFPPQGPPMGGQTIGVLSASANYGGYLTSDLGKYFGPLGLNPQIVPISIDNCINGTCELPTVGGALAGQTFLTFASTPNVQASAQLQFMVLGVNYYFLVISTPTSPTVQIGYWEVATQSYVSAPLSVEVPAMTPVYFNLDDETTQDICIAGSAAAGANLAVYLFYGDPVGWVEVINRVIEPEPGDFPPGVNPASVLTFSYSMAWGDDPNGMSMNPGLTASLIEAMTAAYQDAALFTITVCAATADFGSNSTIGRLAASDTPPFDYSGDGFAHVVYPATDPWVLAVGGTTLGKYLPTGSSTPEWVEYVWNDPLSDPTYPWGTGGGGVSSYFPLPSYQSGAGVPNSINTNTALTPVAGATVPPPVPFFSATGRGIPDVAANASLNTGFAGIYLGGAPSINPGNGTSASTPFWAGLIAVLNANLGYNVGFVNPLFYEWGPSLFSPINPLWPDPAFPQLVLPLPAGCPVDNGNNGIPGYPAGPNWDACTGLGSPNATALLEAFQALGQPYVLGGYQSPDIIITNLTDSTTGAAGTPVQLGGTPNSMAWDTLLVPGLAYGFQATIHNSNSTEEAYIDSVSFWSIPGGVGTAGGTLLATLNTEIAIPPGGSITVPSSYSTVQFTNPGSHACAVVSIYCPHSGCTFNGAQDPVTLAAPPSQDIPDPGPSNSHSCSAWRNTDSMSAAMGASYKFKLGFARPPEKLPGPVVLEIQTALVPFDWNRDPKIGQAQALPHGAGARSNVRLYTLPEFIGKYHTSTLGIKVTALEGGSVTERDGRWSVSPEVNAKATSFEISGEVPGGARKGDVLLVNVTANYPRTAGAEARSVGFLEFIYITENKRIN